MGVIEKAEQAGTARVDVERFRLRRFVESLGDDELETRSDATELADVAAAFEGNARAVLFKAAGPERQALVGNGNPSRARIARAFGVAPARLPAHVHRPLPRKPQIVEARRAAPRA